MRDLSALNMYSMEEFERSKAVAVRTAEDCAKEEEKAAELRNVIADLEKNRAEYKNDRLVDKIVARTNCALNFIIKASSAFSFVADAVNEKRSALEKKRTESAKMLEDSKTERNEAVKNHKREAAAVPAEAVAPKKKAGRPKGRK